MENNYLDILNKIFSNLTAFIINNEELVGYFFDFVTEKTDMEEEIDLKRIGTDTYKDLFQEFIYNNPYIESEKLH